MPSAPRKPCRKPGCGILGTTAFCEKHTIQKKQVEVTQRIKYDAERGSSTSRGYDSRWRKVSLLHRQNNPLCAMCLKKGKLVKAYCVDHIEAVEDKDDPKFYEPSNWQSLCLSCHSEKTAKEDGGLGNKERKL